MKTRCLQAALPLRRWAAHLSFSLGNEEKGWKFSVLFSCLAIPEKAELLKKVTGIFGIKAPPDDRKVYFLITSSDELLWFCFVLLFVFIVVVVVCFVLFFFVFEKKKPVKILGKLARKVIRE